MPNFLSDIPPDERLTVVLIVGAIIFVTAGIIYLKIRTNIWFAKRMTLHASDALDQKKSEKNYEKYVWKTPKKWKKVGMIYTAVGLLLLLIGYMNGYIPFLLFGLSTFIGGFICFSYASMTQEQLDRYLAHKKKQSIAIGRVTILGICALYILFYALPKSFFASIDIFGVFAVLSSLIIIVGTIDHFITRRKLHI